MSEKSWQQARLIPTSVPEGGREFRATSLLLAVLWSVKEFGREFVRPFGAIAGKVALRRAPDETPGLKPSGAVR